jgi:hypothetical protein
LADLWNLFKKDVLYEHVFQIDGSVEIVWGWSDYDRMAANVGVNTLGQFVFTTEDARNMQGSGAVAAGSVGYVLGYSKGPVASSDHIPTYHREVIAAAGYAGYSGSFTTSTGGPVAVFRHPTQVRKPLARA